jgi:hypothetical protein
MIICSAVEVRSYFTTDGQSVSMSWYRAPLWDLWQDITSYRHVAVWNLRSCFCVAPSLTRGRVCRSFRRISRHFTISRNMFTGTNCERPCKFKRSPDAQWFTEQSVETPSSIIDSSAVQTCSCRDLTRKFSTVIIKSYNLIVLWSNSIQFSSSHPSNPLPDPSRGLFTRTFLTKLYTFIFLHCALRFPQFSASFTEQFMRLQCSF